MGRDQWARAMALLIATLEGRPNEETVEKIRYWILEGKKKSDET